MIRQNAIAMLPTIASYMMPRDRAMVYYAIGKNPIYSIKELGELLITLRIHELHATIDENYPYLYENEFAYNMSVLNYNRISDIRTNVIKYIPKTNNELLSALFSLYNYRFIRNTSLGKALSRYIISKLNKFTYFDKRILSFHGRNISLYVVMICSDIASSCIWQDIRWHRYLAFGTLS